MTEDEEPVEEAGPHEEAVDWLDAASQEFEDANVEEYDIVSAPNDWNVSTIVDFISSGAVKIPAFQRNFVWDIKRSSKLIESLLLGLPVPQVFLYEESRNSFLVIDGQQRLLSLLFFAKGRFPRSGSRGALRVLLKEGAVLSEEALHDDELFEDFRLRLGKSTSGQVNRFHRKTYAGLGDHRTTLNLRTIRNVVVKQTRPAGDSAIFEIFSRLNTGGVNLGQQEIRASLFHSRLMSEVIDLNLEDEWRELLGVPRPDARMRDTEIVLRSMALARGLSSYSGSMTAFVNRFCREAQRFEAAQAVSATDDFRTFLNLLDANVSPAAFRRADGSAVCSSRVSTPRGFKLADLTPLIWMTPCFARSQRVTTSRARFKKVRRSRRTFERALNSRQVCLTEAGLRCRTKVLSIVCTATLST